MCFFVAVVGGSAGGVVGLGGIVGLLFKLRRYFLGRRPPPQSHHTSSHGSSPLHQYPPHSGGGGQTVPDWGFNAVNSGVASMSQNVGQFYDPH